MGKDYWQKKAENTKLYGGLCIAGSASRASQGGCPPVSIVSLYFRLKTVNLFCTQSCNLCNIFNRESLGFHAACIS